MKITLSLAIVLSCFMTSCAAPVDQTQEIARQKELLTRFDKVDKNISGFDEKINDATELTYEVRDVNENRPFIGYLTTNYPLTKGEVVHFDDDVYEVEGIISFTGPPITTDKDSKKYYLVGSHRVLVRFVSKATKAPKD
jgi:hypothetical protein